VAAISHSGEPPHVALQGKSRQLLCGWLNRLAHMNEYRHIFKLKFVLTMDMSLGDVCRGMNFLSLSHCEENPDSFYVVG